MNETECVLAAKRGDHEALAELLQTNYLFVFKYLLQLALHQPTAEDLTQETMIRAIEKIRLYDETRSKFSSWLLTIATRLYLDHQRRKRREKGALASATHDAKDETRHVRWQVESLNGDWSLLIDALAHLRKDTRAAVILKHYYGYEYREIADILNIPTGTAKSRVHHGLRELRKEWAQGEEGTNSHG
ncbi:RNA polymerase sigma factor SigY [Alicyclobacillus fastidiosus]|uniref:RNA polymerase sigma factor n=1 Tax=Alicyclobacillus fastidiosus TaxID=392011 RepID=A0ABV5AMF0_9BACL|nr:RNA polymerase sigma factor SigY [Alicyclobacillus fastidiosus]WEH08333.1 RNA polymerase sigma factor SigY [Alicyclobacillus fastidiosus]